jgi:hypothetical protein
MTVEYILLLSLFVFMVAGALIGGPQKAFDKAGFKLSARVEKHLITGDGFGNKSGNGTTPLQWK